MPKIVSNDTDHIHMKADQRTAPVQRGTRIKHNVCALHGFRKGPKVQTIAQHCNYKTQYCTSTDAHLKTGPIS